jgi:hypothetical protein
MVLQAGYPGSKMIPAPQAWLALLALKLSSAERKSHVMDFVFDEGLALFAGLNAVPKTTYLETYSHSVSTSTVSQNNKSVVECFCGCANPSASTTRETPRGIFGLAGASRGAC